MRFSKRFSVLCSFFMCLIMSNLPAVALADQKMISSSEFIQTQDRAQTEQKIKDLLNRDDVKKAFVERGVSPEEASLRIASLSDAELKELSGQVQYARAGGDILFTILIVVLIIFLIKRL